MNVWENRPHNMIRAFFVPERFQYWAFWRRAEQMVRRAHIAAGYQSRHVSVWQLCGDLCALSTFYGIEAGQYGVPGHDAWAKEINIRIASILSECDYELRYA